MKKPPRLIVGHTYRDWSPDRGFYIVSMSGRGRNRMVTYHDCATPAIRHTVPYRDCQAHASEDVTDQVAYAVYSIRVIA